jgi:hypothetical protein
MISVSVQRRSRNPATQSKAPQAVVPSPKQHALATHLREHIDSDQRQAMVAEAAYFFAESRGFDPGHELDDWLAAEDQVAAALSLAEQQAAARMMGRGRRT